MPLKHATCLMYLLLLFQISKIRSIRWEETEEENYKFFEGLGLNVFHGFAKENNQFVE